MEHRTGRTLLDRMSQCQRTIEQIRCRLASGRSGWYGPDRLYQRLLRLAARSKALLAERDGLVIQFTPLVHHVAGRFKSANPSLSYDDLVSAGTVGLILAAERWREGGGASHKTYFYRSIWSHLVKECGLQTPAGLPRGLQLEPPSDDGDDLITKVPDDARELECESDEVASLHQQVNMLPAHWRKAVRARYLDPDVGQQTLQAAAADLGIPTSTASELIQCGLNRLREVFGVKVPA